LRAWLDEHGDDLRLPRPHTHEDRFRHGQDLARTMWAAGWKRAGWPPSLDGLGGGPRHRATYYDELSRAGIDLPDTDSSIEVIGRAMVHSARAVAEAYLPRLWAGEEIWGQAFSEPDAGSDLASLRTRGTVGDEQVVVDGQKVWTSHGHLASRY